MKVRMAQALVLFALLVPAVAQVQQPVAGVPGERLALLSRGINLNDWFSAWANPTHYSDNFRPEEAAFLKGAGFTVCRMPLGTAVLFNPDNPGVPNDNLAAVDHAVRLLLNAGLAVIFDPIHDASSDSAWERRLAHDPAFLGQVEAFWEGLARHYAAFSSDKIFFEIMNEPHLTSVEKIDQSWWPPVQKALAAAIRRGAPSNTIIATGEKWGSLDGLMALQPLSDRNVVYSFHWYEPFTFTHQGAVWTGPIQAELSSVPYPSSPEAVARPAAALSDPSARNQVINYGKQDWNIDRIREGLARAGVWGKVNDVPVFCGEFGAYRKVSDPAARERWIHDVRSVLESFGIGWAMWDYETDFGLVTFGEPFWRREPRVDTGYLRALGLDEKATLSFTDAPTLADFLAGKIASLAIPPEFWSGLWTREKDTGTVGFQKDAAGKMGDLVLSIRSSRDWSLSVGPQIPVQTGETLRLISTASVTGKGSLSLAFVARNQAGQVLDWGFATVDVRNGSPKTVELTALATPGVASLEPRWFGLGVIDATIGTVNLVRKAPGKR
jgi:aryl-phospho-beta-D-glucosidase BglC (GH1 family)